MSLLAALLYSLPAFMLLAVYYAVLYYRLKHQPLKTMIGIYHATRKAWVRSVLKNHSDILTIQTLRNWSMSATFLASTASLFALGVVSMLLDTEAVKSVAMEHNVLLLDDADAIEFFRIKAQLLMVVLFVSFFNFTLAIRYYNKAGFILCIHETHTVINHNTYAIQTVSNGALHYLLGMRSYYTTVPLVLWLLGNSWLYFGIFLVILIQYRTDYKP